MELLKTSTAQVLIVLSWFLEVRELDGIPLILDNCNIDSNNPCILFYFYVLAAQIMFTIIHILVLFCCSFIFLNLSSSFLLRGVQTRIKSLNGTPVVICQWAVFTIRNLLEENGQNQELVSSLEREGPVDYSALRELGFQVEERDGSLLLKPVRKDS